MNKIKWIKCSRRLPPKSKIVLITDGNQVGLGFRGYGGRTLKEDKKKVIFFRPVNCDPFDTIVAWACLPKAPKYKDVIEKSVVRYPDNPYRPWRV